MWGARKQTKKQRFRKCVFIIVCPNGSLFHPCGGQGKGKNEKTTFDKMWFFRGLPIRVSMSSMWGAREKEKNEKKHVLENVFFSWFAHTGFFYVTHVGGKETNEKTTF